MGKNISENNMMKEINELILAAKSHPLFNNVLNTNGNIVISRGNLDHPEILFIGEAPWKEENKIGMPFVGKSGQLLETWIKEAGINSYAIINAIPIIPLDSVGNVRTPTFEEIEYFKPYIQDLINTINPKKIICLGKIALSLFEINIESGEWQENIGFIYHPAYFLRKNMSGTEDFKNLMLFNKILKEEFIINKQQADNLGHKEMISGLLAGLHFFAQQGNLYFKDINQSDECYLDKYKVKIYTRDVYADDDMLVYDSYYNKHPEIDIYICCKIKAGYYHYLGYVSKEIIKETRAVKMIGQESDEESKLIRRIFEQQYLPINNLIKIYEEKTIEEKIIPHQQYVPLHLHTEYSVGDGFGTVQYIADCLYKKGFKGAAITDHGTLAGVWQFQKKLLEKNIKPIIGCEIYLKIPESEKRMHSVVLVKNRKGWENLLHLQALATREHFYYHPVIPINLLFEYHEGLILTSGCSDSPINTAIKMGDIQLAEKYLSQIKELWKDDFYGEIQPHEILNNQTIMQTAFNLFKKYQVKCIFTTDSHYPYQEDKKYHEAIKAIGLKKKYGEAGFGDDCFYLMDEKEIQERIEKNPQNEWMKEIISELKNNTLEILGKISFLIQTEEKDTLPKLFKNREESKEKFKEMCINGLYKNTPYKYEGIIKDRLDLEMNRILEKEYENYFLIVHDMIDWARKNGILVGPGRGSVGASLAAYALNISEVDPLQYNLLFDRFISEIRKDAPDIDIDYQDDRRDEIFTYLKNKYGENNCAKVATYSRFHPKGIMRDIGRIFNIPIYEIEKICSLVIVRSGGDARASFSLLDTFEEFGEAKKFREQYPEPVDIAIKLESHIRHKGIHAAAMVICNMDICNYTPITKISSIITTEWEKQEIEDIKIIKFDILGLKTLTVLSDCIKETKISVPKTFDDEKVYQNIFETGNTLGVFQFETVGLGKLAKRLKIDKFNILYDATTLFRPGALHSGQTMLYVSRHLGESPIKYEHPLLEEITKDTKGIILYQEQIMQIMHTIGGMSWATAEMSRKVMTKSKGKKAFEEFRKEFVRNANNIHNMVTIEAEKLYDVVSTFGSYSFNKVHAVEYSMISYYCAWYKYYYPAYFYNAILKYETDDTQILNYIQEAEKIGIKIEYPDINESQYSYHIKNKTIFSGFNSVKGVGLRTAQKIIKYRPYKDFEDFLKRCKINKNVMKGLIIADCFRNFKINKKVCLSDEINNVKNYYDKLQEDFSEIEYTRLILENTSLRPKIHILDAYNFGNYKFVNINQLNQSYENEMGYVRGIVTKVINKDKLIRNDIKQHVHKFEPHMIYLNLNDGTGSLALQVNPHTYTKYKDIINQLENKPIIAYGKFSKDAIKMYAELFQFPEQKGDIDSLINNLKQWEEGYNVIISSSPAVSKNGKSYYRIIFDNKAEGLYFNPKKPIYPGEKVKYKQNNPPFVNLIFRKEGDK